MSAQRCTLKLCLQRCRRAAVCASWFAAVLTAALAGCASRDVAPSYEMTQEPWTFQGMPGQKITTDHYEFYTTTGDETLRDYLPGFLEACYREYAKLVPPDETGGEKRMETYLFASQRQWDSFTRDRFPTRYNTYSRIQVGAFAAGDMCVAYEIQPRTYTLSVIAHEGMHQYLSLHFGEQIPAWLNEGLASYCEGFDASFNRPLRMTPMKNLSRINGLREALAGDMMLPLPELLGTDAGRVIRKSQTGTTRTYYAQAWAMIVFLRHGPYDEYRAGLDRMIADLAAGKLAATTMTSGTASVSPSGGSFGESVFRTYITTDYETFNERFDQFVKKLAFG